MDGQMTFEFAQRPTIKGFPELRWTGKRPTVLRNTSRLSFVSAMAKKRMAGLTKSSGEIIFR